MDTLNVLYKLVYSFIFMLVVILSTLIYGVVTGSTPYLYLTILSIVYYILILLISINFPNCIRSMFTLITVLYFTGIFCIIRNYRKGFLI